MIRTFLFNSIFVSARVRLLCFNSFLLHLISFLISLYEVIKPIIVSFWKKVLQVWLIDRTVSLFCSNYVFSNFFH